MAQSNQVKNLMPRHEAIVDWEILNPGGTQRECSAALDMGEAQISIIRHSDIFIDYRSRRLRAHHENISDSVVGKVENVACLSLDIMHERFSKERETIPLGGVKDTAEMTLKALGFGMPKSTVPPAVGGNVTVIIGAPPALLEQARNKMRTVNETPETLEPAKEGPETVQQTA